MKSILILLLPLFFSCQKTLEKPDSLGSVLVNVRAYLQAAYNPATGQMERKLHNGSVLPTYQPYNRAPWFYMGSEFWNNENPTIVDWALCELKTPEGITKARAAGFIKQDGWVIDMNGRPGITFTLNELDDDPNIYHVVLRHRNHLGIRTRNPINFRDYNGQAIVNFTFAGDYVYQNKHYTSTVHLGTGPGETSAWAMRAGNSNPHVDAVVKRNGPYHDNDHILNHWLGGNITNHLDHWYWDADINMDASIDSLDVRFLNDTILKGSLSLQLYEQL